MYDCTDRFRAGAFKTCATKTKKVGDPIVVIESGKRVIVDADVAKKQERLDYYKMVDTASMLFRGMQNE